MWRGIPILGQNGPTHLPFTQQNDYIYATNDVKWWRYRVEGAGAGVSL